MRYSGNWGGDYGDDYLDPSNPHEHPLVEVVYQKRIKETDYAVQYELSTNLFEPWRVWIPKSQIVDEDVKPDGTLIVMVPEWLAEADGLPVLEF